MGIKPQKGKPSLAALHSGAQKHLSVGSEQKEVPAPLLCGRCPRRSVLLRTRQLPRSAQGEGKGVPKGRWGSEKRWKSSANSLQPEPEPEPKQPMTGLPRAARRSGVPAAGLWRSAPFRSLWGPRRTGCAPGGTQFLNLSINLWGAYGHTLRPPATHAAHPGRFPQVCSAALLRWAGRKLAPRPPPKARGSGPSLKYQKWVIPRIFLRLNIMPQK